MHEVILPGHLITVDPASYKPRLIDEVNLWLQNESFFHWKFDYDLEWTHNKDGDSVLNIHPKLLFNRNNDAVMFKICWL